MGRMAPRGGSTKELHRRGDRGGREGAGTGKGVRGDPAGASSVREFCTTSAGIPVALGTLHFPKEEGAPCLSRAAPSSLSGTCYGLDCAPPCCFDPPVSGKCHPEMALPPENGAAVRPPSPVYQSVMSTCGVLA